MADENEDPLLLDVGVVGAVFGRLGFFAENQVRKGVGHRM